MNSFQPRKEAFRLINSSREERERRRILTTSKASIGGAGMSGMTGVYNVESSPRLPPQNAA